MKSNSGTQDSYEQTPVAASTSSDSLESSTCLEVKSLRHNKRKNAPKAHKEEKIGKANLVWKDLYVTSRKEKKKILLDGVSGKITGGFWAIMVIRSFSAHHNHFPLQYRPTNTS